eukprot:9164063-Ditylum_brightwellii.AAC.1
MKRSCHHDDEASIASGNRSVSVMSTDASVIAISALQQHQTAMLQQQQQMQMQQMQQQAAQQFAYQAPVFQYPLMMMPLPQHPMSIHSPWQQANGATAAAAATQVGTSLQAVAMAGNAGAEMVSPASQNVNSAISPHVQHHAESVIRNLDQAIEDAKNPPK